MKKIIYSLLICFVLLFTIPSVHAANETVYIDGKELIVTSTKAFSGPFPIPDSVGYFEEFNANSYGYVVGEKIYQVYKTELYLPKGIYNPDSNLFPTFFDEIYVINGYWAYNNNLSFIVADKLYSTKKSDLFSSDLTFNECLFNCCFNLNNTFGFFILKENYFYYVFYNTFLIDNNNIIDFSTVYIALFSKSSFYLPKNLLFVNYKENCSSYLNDDLTFYGISNNKWLIKKSFSTLNIKHNIDGIVFLELDKMVTSYKYPVFYFNFQNSKFDSTLLNIDYLYEISYDLKLVCKEKNHTRLISSTCYPETKRDVVFPKLFYKNQYDRIVDSNIENLDYFEYNNKLYRFKMVDIPENGFDMFFLYCDYIESYKIYNAVYSYESVLYYNHDPDQTIVIDNNCQDINFVKIFKDVFFYSFLIIFLILTIKIIIYLNNKKNKK